MCMVGVGGEQQAIYLDSNYLVSENPRVHDAQASYTYLRRNIIFEQSNSNEPINQQKKTSFFLHYHGVR